MNLCLERAGSKVAADEPKVATNLQQPSTGIKHVVSKPSDFILALNWIQPSVYKTQSIPLSYDSYLNVVSLCGIWPPIIKNQASDFILIFMAQSRQ